MGKMFNDCVVSSEIAAKSYTLSDNCWIKSKEKFSDSKITKNISSSFYRAYPFFFVESNFEASMVERSLYRKKNTTINALGIPQRRPDRKEYFQ